jgi:protein-S-isoprenylcysteine O-methyltransferase Ste14
MGMLTAEYPTLPKSVQDSLRWLLDAMDQWLTRVLEQGQAQGYLRPEPEAPVMARVMINAMKRGESMRNAVSGKQPVSAMVIMHGAALAGRLSLLAFVVFIFEGSFNLTGTNLQPSRWLIRDTLLSLLFFMQHSGMIRRSFRNWMARRIPHVYHGAVFTTAASLALALVVVFWQSSGPPLFSLGGPLRWLARGVFFAGAAGIAWGYWSLRGFDPYGIAPIRARLSGTAVQPQPLTIRGPYKWVRHPLYFFVLLMLWSFPEPTADRLLFNLLWTGWIFSGAVFEEKDLLAEFGKGYREYQRTVPMLIPWKGFTCKKGGS